MPKIQGEDKTTETTWQEALVGLLIEATLLFQDLRATLKEERKRKEKYDR